MTRKNQPNILIFVVTMYYVHKDEWIIKMHINWEKSNLNQQVNHAI